MNNNKTLFLLVAVLVIVSIVYGVSDESFAGIIDVTDENVEEVLNDNNSKATFIEFYAPWCGHCQRLMPELAKLGEAMLHGSDHAEEVVQIVKVNCDKYKSICQKYTIKGYPTLRFIPKNGGGEMEAYEGNRKAEDIAKFINDRTGAKIKIENDVSQVIELTPQNFDQVVMQPDKHVLVAFYAPWCGYCKKMAPTYDRGAKLFANDDVVFARVDAHKYYEDYGKKYDIEGYPTLILFPKITEQTTEKQPIPYDIQSEELSGLVTFLNERAGTNRDSHGFPNDQAGLIESFTQLATQFVSADGVEARDKIIEEAKSALENVEESAQIHAQQYLKYMAKIVEKGEQYVTGELARLSGLLEKIQNKLIPVPAGGSVDDIKRRSNILGTFLKKQQQE